MNKNLYFVGMTSISELLLSHEKDQPLFYSIDTTALHLSHTAGNDNDG